jgi:uncharacterized protein (TIGR02646 family)
MIWIDLKHKLPTDTDIAGWTPWTQARWAAWLANSQRLVDELAALHAASKREERNALIDANAGHWGELKGWLLALSWGKCWFSEVRDLYSHYDVEHFRPKKEAKGLVAINHRDGYWWLAFDYMNFRVCGNVGNRKKGGWFPLRQGSLCSTFAQPCEESEDTYLLDPVNDDDVDLIAFDEEGKVIPAPGISEWDVLRVTETIKRLKLNEHQPLSEARRKVWQKVSGLVEEFQHARSRCAANTNPAMKERIRNVRDLLRNMTEREAELSSVARWCVHFRNDPQLARLIA